jgi:hypothetical protein
MNEWNALLCLKHRLCEGGLTTSHKLGENFGGYFVLGPPIHFTAEFRSTLCPALLLQGMRQVRSAASKTDRVLLAITRSWLSGLCTVNICV